MTLELVETFKKESIRVPAGESVDVRNQRFLSIYFKPASGWFGIADFKKVDLTILTQDGKRTAENDSGPDQSWVAAVQLRGTPLVPAAPLTTPTTRPVGVDGSATARPSICQSSKARPAQRMAAQEVRPNIHRVAGVGHPQGEGVHPRERQHRLQHAVVDSAARLVAPGGGRRKAWLATGT
ncbi:hypothetical protein AB0C81_18645 [Streptomyces roseoverticillatus]|uniref:hypothetical protein n=1 Tax=Streptomyces roseoverticillatus TaxID=66429 RepID=UPI003407F4CE